LKSAICQVYSRIGKIRRHILKICFAVAKLLISTVMLRLKPS